MRIEHFIVIRYLKNFKKSKEISDSTLIVIIAIAIAIIFFISAVSVMNGYIHGRMKIQFELVSFHLLYTEISNIENALYILESIKKDKDIRHTGIFREAKVLLSANQINTGLVYFRSIEESVFQKDNGLNQILKIIEGEKSISNNEILISKKTKDKLKVKVGDTLYLTLISNDKDNNSKVIFKRLKISGIFTTGFTELDEQLAFINEKIGDEILKNIPYNIFVKLKDYRKTKEFLKRNGFYKLSYPYMWMDYNYNEFTALNFEKGVIALIVILVVFVAMLNILNVINITILEKKEDIAILKSIGASSENIIVIFLLNGIYIGFTGLIFGLIFGLFIMKYLNEIMIIFSEIFNFILLSANRIISFFINIPEPDRIEFFSKDFYLDKIYTDIYFHEIVLITFLTLIFSILVSFIPAMRSGIIKPNEVIKNG